MNENNFLAADFEANRGHLRAVAYRMLGSLSEADDAVQEAWLHASRPGAPGVANVVNLGGWLTTVVARVCLDMLRSRKARREDAHGAQVPDPIVAPHDTVHPEHEVLFANAVGLALLVVLETLPPAERLAFVLHDMFALSFDEIAPIVDRTPTATRQLASRARRRVQGAPTTPDPDLARQRQVVQAFLAASRAGDFDALVAVLDPDVVLRADRGAGHAHSKEERGAATVAKQSLLYARSPSPARTVHPALINGAAGVVTFEGGRPYAILAFTVVGGLIVEIDLLADPDRLAQLDLSMFAP